MANEVIIEEYDAAGLQYPDGQYAPMPGALITTQIMSIATVSGAFDTRTNFIRLQSKGVGFWYRLGGASPDAIANIAGNRWLPADQFRDIYIVPGIDIKIDTAV